MQLVKTHRTEKASLSVVYDRNEVIVNCYLTETLGELVRAKFIDPKKADTAFIRLRGALELYKNYDNSTPSSIYLKAVIKDLL